MGNTKRPARFGVVVAVGGLIILGGCAQYHIAGHFEDTRQQFFGFVSVSMGDSGTLEAKTKDGTVTCKGTTQVTKRPSGYTTIGGRGAAQAKCSDGRTFKVDFVQTQETGGHGQGLDSNGRIVRVFFDTSQDGANARLKKNLLDKLVQ